MVLFAVFKGNLNLEAQLMYSTPPQGIDLFHAAAILVREHRFRTLIFELAWMGTSSRGAKGQFSVPGDSIWPIFNKSLPSDGNSSTL